MGFFDFLSGGGTPEAKAQKLKPKVVQKYGEATTRQAAIHDVIDLKAPAATVPVLMSRFTINVEPQTTDQEEKTTVFNAIADMGPDAVPLVVDFLSKSEAASSWALKLLEELLEENEVIGLVAKELTRLGAEYTRDPEKKEVLLQFLAGKTDERVGPATAPFLNDMSDEVKLCAIKTLASIKFEPSREALLQLATGEETAKRVQTACIQALADTSFPTQGYQKKIEALLVAPYFLDKSGIVKRRGATA